jgi:hypothetical protein
LGDRGDVDFFVVSKHYGWRDVVLLWLGSDKQGRRWGDDGGAARLGEHLQLVLKQDDDAEQQRTHRGV